MAQPLNIAVACGGTGGHLFPGLAVARELRTRGHNVTLWLSGRNTEATVIQDWAGATVTVPATGMAGLSMKSIRSMMSLGKAYRTSRRIMRANTPHILLGMGSYAIVGPVLAARSLRVPVILHEANTVPGRAISFLSNLATCTAITFPDSAHYFPRRRTVLTGLPIRELTAGPSASGLSKTHDAPVVLVMGGSQGANFINDTASLVFAELHKEGVPISVIHLTGERDFERIQQRYQTLNVPATVLAFLKDMGSAYSIASLAISRSGASSCMELAAWKIPAIYIPLPTAMRNHQYHNAVAMAQSGGAICIEQEILSADTLKAQLRALLQDSKALTRMKAHINDSHAKGGTTRLADLIEKEAQQHAHL